MNRAKNSLKVQNYKEYFMNLRLLRLFKNSIEKKRSNSQK